MFKVYTFQVSGQDDEGYLKSTLVTVTADNEQDAETKA